MEISLIPKTEFDRIAVELELNESLLSLYADMCRYNTFVSVKKAGSGHLGSSFSAMDLIIYLYLKEMNTTKVGLDSNDRDIYFSSKGHDVPGLYSLFYSLGYISEEQLLKLRRFNGLDGHPDVATKGIESNTGSLGMGISKGKGMAWAKEYLSRNGRIFVLTGDGEFQEGQIFESLQSTAHQRINNITVIIDRNKFQTDMLVDDVNSIEDLEKKVTSFGWFVTRCQGHDFKSIGTAINSTKEIKDIPKFIIADTVKGKGISFLESPYDINGVKMYKWHSGAPDDDSFEKGIAELKKKIAEKCELNGLSEIRYKFIEHYEKAISLPSKKFVTDAFGDTLCELAEKREDFVVIDADLAADCKLRRFQDLYPDRFIENGIAEQDMVSMAGGLAKSGILPIVSSFASFLTSRANEQIYNNACEKTKIIYVCNFAGLIPAGPGKSHQSVRDISLLGAIPNMVIAQPCNLIETKQLAEYFINSAKENCALRLNIGPSPCDIQLPDDYQIHYGKGTVLKEGRDAICFGYGPVLLHEALTAANLLEKIGFSLKVVNLPWINRIDKDWLESMIYGFSEVFIIDDHSTTGGLGDCLISTSISSGVVSKHFVKIGLDEYPACGTPQEILEYHKLDGKSLAERISGKYIFDNDVQEANYTADAPQ